VAAVSDAVVIGSRLIQLIEDQPHEKVASVAVNFLRDIRTAID
jgi:tryptophan synthase alpha chain